MQLTLPSHFIQVITHHRSGDTAGAAKSSLKELDPINNDTIPTDRPRTEVLSTTVQDRYRHRRIWRQRDGELPSISGIASSLLKAPRAEPAIFIRPDKPSECRLTSLGE